jgi:hypothetical protein
VYEIFKSRLSYMWPHLVWKLQDLSNKGAPGLIVYNFLTAQQISLYFVVPEVSSFGRQSSWEQRVTDSLALCIAAVHFFGCSDRLLLTRNTLLIVYTSPVVSNVLPNQYIADFLGAFLHSNFIRYSRLILITLAVYSYIFTKSIWGHVEYAILIIVTSWRCHQGQHILTILPKSEDTKYCGTCCVVR